MAKENVQVSEEKVGFVKGTIRELKQVTWPKAPDLAGKTGVVLAVVVLGSLFIWLVDTGLSQLLGLLIK